MTIELYEADSAASAEAINLPVSSTTGELPEQEPALDLGDLLGSFDSQEEAIIFIEEQAAQQNRQIIDSAIVAYDAYTHVSLLTVTIQSKEQPTQQKNYYLVTDEGY